VSIRLAVPYAYNRFRPGFGFLPDDFPYTKTKIIPLDEKRGVARFGAESTFPSTLLREYWSGAARGDGQDQQRAAWMHGGNMDNKELVAGTTLFLPVHAPGALLLVGDGHAGQGNGEVDITAMETSLIGTFQLIVRKNMHLRWPRAETPSHYITMGFNEDLNEATKMAVREMIDFLVSEKHLTRDDAYMLSSVAADLSITQLVDGTKEFTHRFPKRFFAISSTGGWRPRDTARISRAFCGKPPTLHTNRNDRGWSVARFQPSDYLSVSNELIIFVTSKLRDKAFASAAAISIPFAWTRMRRDWSLRCLRPRTFCP